MRESDIWLDKRDGGLSLSIIEAGIQGLDSFQKLYFLAQSFNFSFKDAQKLLFVSDDKLLWRCDGLPAVVIDSLENQSHAYIEFMRRDNSELYIEGRLSTVMSVDSLDFVVVAKDVEHHATLAYRFDRSHDAPSERGYAHDVGFQVRVPLCDFSFVFYMGEKEVVPQLEAGKFCPMSFWKQGYAPMGDFILSVNNREGASVKVERKTVVNQLKHEITYSSKICRKRPSSCRLLPRRYYGLLHRGKPKRERIWLISDRPHLAGDNGEALFAYLQAHPIPGVKPCFVLNRESCDYSRLSKVGKVVAFGSSEHARLQMRAEFIISSAADEFVCDRFEGLRYLEKGINSPKFVFLQHGVIKDDMSKWLNRYNKNIALFITSSERERRSILDNAAYDYDESQVVLTGLPRHDALLEGAKRNYESRGRKVLIAPTWRESIAGKTIGYTGRKAENPDFCATAYCRFYTELLNSEELGMCAEKNGYSIRFLIHPAFMQEAHKFNSVFAEISSCYDYRTEFLTSDILVTDFSSVAFDFALLKKPIIYTQFDHDTFYETHAWEKSYFDYVDDGFGEVCTTLEDSVSTLVQLMENPIMPREYEERVEKFFFAPKRTRCEEVTRAILELSNRLARFPSA